MQIVFFNGIDFSSSVLFSIITASSPRKIHSRKNGKSFKIKIFAYDVIRMEENEEDVRFWYICGKFAYAICKYNEINDEEKNNENKRNMYISS